MAIYLVSDVHGCFDELMAVLELVEFSNDDTLFILGDLIDRGPKIGECIEWIVAQNANNAESNVNFLMGNHEEMATWAFAGRWSEYDFDEVYVNPWLRNGGGETIGQMKELDASTVDDFARIVSHAPKAKALKVNGEVVLMCHAGIRPAEPESEVGEWLIQSAGDLLWIGNEWYCAPEQAPFHVVSGHVPVYALAGQPVIPDCPYEIVQAGESWHMMHWGSKHDIDCGCVYGGNMGLLRLHDWQEFYVPASRKM